MFNKGFSLLKLVVILAIIGILIAVSGRIYHNYISKAKIAGLLSGIKSKKIELVEKVKQANEVNDDHRIVIDTDHIKDNSMLIISPIIIGDNVYWGCNRIGLSESQVPHFCNLNDFTQPQINISNEVNCQVSQGISYNETTKTFNVNVKMNGKIISLGSFEDAKKATETYLNYLD